MKKFSLETLKKIEDSKEKNERPFKKEVLKEHGFVDKSTKVYLINEIKDEVSTFDLDVFDKTLAFTKFFLAEKGQASLNDSSWYLQIASNFKKQFIEFYEFFLENNSNIGDVSNYYEDFKSFFSGDYLKESERYEKEIETLGAKESNWYKGIMDAFNQEPSNEKFWSDDEYYTGYQRGTDIFRGLMKEAKLLFPVKKPKNKFVEQQQKLAGIINRFGTDPQVRTGLYSKDERVENSGNDLMKNIRGIE